jgi:hypothetical protein
MHTLNSTHRRIRTRTAVVALAAGCLLSTSLVATSARADAPPLPKQTIARGTSPHIQGTRGASVLPRPRTKPRKIAPKGRRGAPHRRGTKALARLADASTCNLSGCYRALTTFHSQSYQQTNQYGNHWFGWQVYNVTSGTSNETYWKYWYAWTGTQWVAYTRVEYRPASACWTFGGDANCAA